MRVKLIIGLGNPGAKYEETYHNAGFLFIDYLINKNPVKIKSQFAPPAGGWRTKMKKFEYFKFGGLLLVKPLTFMNESGKAVKEAIKYFKIKSEEVLVVHDDSDIKLGKRKISFGRGAAGHRGVQSIIDSLGSKNFWRLRIGVRHKPKQTTHKPTQEKFRVSPRSVSVSPCTKASAFVLKKIGKEDMKMLEKIFQETINILKCPK